MARRAAAAVAAMMLLGGLAPAENLVSGPQPGERLPGEFRVLFVSGDHAGERGSPVSLKGATATGLIFVNDVGDALTALLRRIDRRLDEAPAGGDESPRVFVVFSGDDARLRGRLKDLAAAEAWKRVVVCCGPADGIDKWEIAEESVLTAVLVKDGAVKANFAFRKEEFTRDWADAILKALSDVLPR